MAGKLILLQGISGAGKSTWALNYLKVFPEARIVNRDSLRYMLVNKGWEPSIEDTVTKVEHMLVRSLLKEGRTVLEDNTNLNPKTARRLRAIAEECG